MAMNVYSVDNSQLERLMEIAQGSYSFIGDGVLYAGNGSKTLIRDSEGRERGVVWDFHNEGERPVRMIFTSDPKLQQALSKMGIEPSGVVTAPEPQGPTFNLNRKQLDELMQRLGADYGRFDDTSRMTTFVVQGRDGNERRIRGNEAIRNDGMGSAAVIHPTISEFGGRRTIGYTITTSDPRILQELQQMGITGEAPKARQRS